VKKPRDLTELAQGQSCYLRLYPFCTHDTTKVVLAHFRVGGTGGTSLKPPDICGVPACQMCHDVIDGRYKQKAYQKTMLDAECYRAQNQWLEFLWKNELIIPVLA
jgi:hypothetical protein